MKNSLGLLFALTLVAHADPWKLVWSDDFNRAGAPDPTKWTYEKGFVRNQELQFYTDNRRENARVEGGNLVIEARKEAFPNPSYVADAKDWQKSRKEAEYTSAALITKGLKSFKYGKIEVRAKLPSGKGIWPAIWMLGDNRGPTRWPMCGEIDIMEFVSHTPGVVHGTLHFAKPGTTEHQSAGGQTKSDSLHTTFHTYGVEWNEKTITLLFDDKAYKTVDLDAAGAGEDNPFRKPFYLLLNVAVGGSWGKEPDPKVYPQRMEVDWVKVWEKP
ncbi:glycoside hydrolase family 16 protein [Luteolibacter ambystomatis]|uniref:Glycoside hydrolase family 16 protein n=1 Tax=Luteolibacter ambystomatis TaxID=2824561 RepID=A0A975G9T4_9BACT|nr:glycoside hydrolase family 16 protein [Luteolibacter ambystomatis]QUE51365.1 glycoside hydrolase family 16 protein [Luteolibacter ambystomatis]